MNRDAGAESASNSVPTQPFAMSDVVVAGGGLIGAAIAWRTAQRGLRVAVVDPDPGSGASHAAAGMIAPVSEATYGEERLLRLCLESTRRFPEFVAELEAATGHAVGLRSGGTLKVAFDADDVRAIEHLHAFHLELGLPATRVTPSEARRIEPGLTPRLRAAIHVPGELSVDGRVLHSALVTAAAGAGVTFVRAKVASVTVENGRAVGVTLADGSVVPGGTVVLALGAYSGDLAGAPPLPVRPVGGQILRLNAHSPDAMPQGSVRALVRGRSVYLVPLAPHPVDAQKRRGAGTVIVGATSEEKGWDSRVTAGAVHDLLREAIEVLPGLAEADFAETLVRFRPGTPDNAPILGPTELPGLVAATGHHRHGVMLTPVTADTIAELLDTGRLPALAEGLGAERFSSEPEVRATSAAQASPEWPRQSADRMHIGGPR
jgi:glycine oxidase